MAGLGSLRPKTVPGRRPSDLGYRAYSPTRCSCRPSASKALLENRVQLSEVRPNSSVSWLSHLADEVLIEVDQQFSGPRGDGALIALERWLNEVGSRIPSTDPVGGFADMQNPSGNEGDLSTKTSAISAARPLGREALLIPSMIAQSGDLTSFDKAHAPRITGVQCGTQRHTRRRARRRPYLL
jgi:hypothetical protein